MTWDRDSPCLAASVAAHAQSSSSMRMERIGVFTHSVYGQAQLLALHVSIHRPYLHHDNTHRGLLDMGMCSHAHETSDDPLFTVGCHVTAGELLHVTLDHCNELSDADVAVIARLLSQALGNLAQASIMAHQERN